MFLRNPIRLYVIQYWVLPIPYTRYTDVDRICAKSRLGKIVSIPRPTIRKLYTKLKAFSLLRMSWSKVEACVDEDACAIDSAWVRKGNV